MEPLRCIECGVSTNDVNIRVNVEDGTIHCDGCDTTYGAADVRAVMAAWEAILGWIESHPALKATAEAR